jgi:uncharacterized membrane protein
MADQTSADSAKTGDTDSNAAFVRHPSDPQVREVTVDDISMALSQGLRDFRAAPMFGLVFGGIYALGGMAILALVSAYKLVFLVYPLAAGFALVAPFVAIGIYQVSRMLERGETPTWSSILGSIPRHGRRQIGYMALVAVFGLILWVYIAGFLYALFFGLRPADFPDFIGTIVSTPRGIAFLIIGNAFGALIALVLFSISVVSYPLLLDRDVDFVTAMITSVRAVLAAPGPMVGWGIFIACLVGLAILPMFLGLLLVLPIIGHATWHLYRRAVEP